MADYIKFWLARAVAEVGIFFAIVLAIIGVMLAFYLYDDWSRRLNAWRRKRNAR